MVGVVYLVWGAGTPPADDRRIGVQRKKAEMIAIPMEDLPSLVALHLLVVDAESQHHFHGRRVQKYDEDAGHQSDQSSQRLLVHPILEKGHGRK